MDEELKYEMRREAVQCAIRVRIVDNATSSVDYEMTR